MLALFSSPISHISKTVLVPRMSSLKAYYHTNEEFNLSLFQSSLKTQHIGRSIIYRKSVESTMDLASEQAEQGAPTGTIVLAEEQTLGRGRASRKWSSNSVSPPNYSSPPRLNLYFTVILRPQLAPELSKLNFATAVAVTKAAQSAGISDVGVKWPNDILVNNKKMAGILTDSSFIGSSIIATVGVGINVNQKSSQWDPELKDIATSMCEEVGKTLEREIVLATFCNNLEELLDTTFERVLNEYKKVDLLIGRPIWVMPKKRENPEREAAIALDILPSGSLQVQLESSKEIIELSAEEVSVRNQSL